MTMFVCCILFQLFFFLILGFAMTQFIVAIVANPHASVEAHHAVKTVLRIYPLTMVVVLISIENFVRNALMAFRSFGLCDASRGNEM